MKRWQLIIGVLVAVATVATMAPVFAAPAAQTASARAVFGTVTGAEAAANGGVTLTLDDSGDRITLTVPAGARITLPGVQEPTPADIRADDRVAAAAQADASGALTATSILVARPGVQEVRHLAGVVASVSGTVIGFIAANGTQYTLDIPPSAGSVAAGDVVTLVVSQEARTGLLRALSVVTPDDALVRMQDAVQKARDAKRDDQARNMQALLESLVSSHLGLLRQNLDRVSEQDRGALSQAIQTRGLAYRSALLGLGLTPSVRFTGVVTSVGAGGSSVSVTAPEGGAPVTVQLTAQTAITLDGRPATRGDLAVGQTATVAYEAQLFNATLVQVERRLLSNDQTASLRAQVLRGEVEGAITAVNATATPAKVTIAPATGSPVTLEVGGATRMEVDGESVAVAALPVGRRAYAGYDTATMVARTLVVLPDVQGQTNVSGIIVGVNRKGRTLLLGTQSGQSVELTLPGGLAITRDGLKVTIAEVRAGDLVRPSTRYTVETRTLTRLDVKAPGNQEVAGTIAGTMRTRSGIQTVTVALRGFGTLSLTVTGASVIRRNGEAISFDAVRTGDRVVAAEFNPGNMELVRLTLEASAAQANGVIKAVGDGGLQLTVRRDDGTDVQLRMQKDFPLERNGVRVDATAVTVGDIVLSVQYNPTTAQPVRMVLVEPGVATAAGVISDLDIATRTLDVRPVSGTGAVSVRLAALTVIQRGGAPAALADLKKGDRVVVYYVKDTREARSVSAMPLPPAASAPAEVYITGRIKARTGDAITVGASVLLITADTKVTGDLAVGARVSAVARPATANNDVLVVTRIEVIQQ